MFTLYTFDNSDMVAYSRIEDGEIREVIYVMRNRTNTTYQREEGSDLMTALPNLSDEIMRSEEISEALFLTKKKEYYEHEIAFFTEQLNYVNTQLSVQEYLNNTKDSAL